MIKQSDIEKLVRFSKGLSDREENQYVYSLFIENEENRGFKEHLRKEFDEYFKSNPDEDHNLSYLLDRIHHNIHKNENKKKQTVLKRIYRWYSVAAAVIMIPLLIGGAIWLAGQTQQENIVAENPATSTLFAPLGSRISFSLPDGTRGWLNSGSSLEYDIPFSRDRQITILGEAWLDVAHDDMHPFEVNAGDSKVRVLGTKFNISAYPDEKYVEVVLEEGKVDFSVMGHSSGIEVKPGERLIFKEGMVKINETEVEKYSAWTAGLLVFRSDPMTEVARRIGRWYNVDVELADEKLKEYVIRGTFQDDSLEELFRYLSMTSPIQYRILDRKQLDDGTVQKKKVLVSLKK